VPSTLNNLPAAPKNFERLLGRQVGCEVFMKLRGVAISETVAILLQETRL
jgi:hypothetical protein